MHQQQADIDLAYEVQRILNIDPRSHSTVLDLPPGAPLTQAQTKYRQLMRVLHPDKRTQMGEHLAGGSDACAEAVRRVQQAMEALKVADPYRTFTRPGQTTSAAAPAAASVPPGAARRPPPAATAAGARETQTTLRPLPEEWGDPTLYTIKEGEHWCRLCSRYASDDHVKGKRHKTRAKDPEWWMRGFYNCSNASSSNGAPPPPPQAGDEEPIGPRDESEARPKLVPPPPGSPPSGMCEPLPPPDGVLCCEMVWLE